MSEGSSVPNRARAGGLPAMASRLGRVAAFAALLVAVGGGWAAAGGRAFADQPFQFQDPKSFWLNKPVFQKRGIVIEDDDYIIRERYWILDQNVRGRVIDVECGRDRTWLTVEFGRELRAGWQMVGINIRDQQFVEGTRRATIRPRPYGDGLDIEEEQFTFAYRKEGEQVEPDHSGLILRQEGPVTIVRFPAHLMALVPPRVGDQVRRSGDWHVGVIDGGVRAKGAEGGCTGCIGTVTTERNKQGFLGVKWHQTGRSGNHRFDHLGYYDIEPVEPQ